MNVVLVSVISTVGSRAEIIVYRCFLKKMTVGVGGFGETAFTSERRVMLS